MRHDFSKANGFYVFCTCCDNLLFQSDDEEKAREAVAKMREQGGDVVLFASMPYAEVEIA